MKYSQGNLNRLESTYLKILQICFFACSLLLEGKAAQFDSISDTISGSSNKVIVSPSFQVLNFRQSLSSYIDNLNFADFNNDDYPDILHVANDSVKILINNHNNTFSIVYEDRYTIGDPQRNPYGPYSISKCCDFNSDGYMDFMVMGYGTCKFYANNQNNTFTKITSELDGFEIGDADWGDYDNDGDYDLILIGQKESANGITLNTIIYENKGNNQFDLIRPNIPGLHYGSVKWGDFDNDLDCDILVSGTDIVKNGLFDVFVNNKNQFAPLNIGLPISGGRFYKESFAHFVNITSDTLLNILYDNDPDFPESKNKGLLVNANGKFSIANDTLKPGIYGDFNNDGYTDINSGSKLILFSNDMTSKIQNTGFQGIEVGDFDNDNDLDVLAKKGTKGTIGDEPTIQIYRNLISTVNSKPSVPKNLSVEISNGIVFFRWDKASDSNTPQNCLTYNMRIGTTFNGVDILSPMSNLVTGKRKIFTGGNTFLNNRWKIENLKPGKYYWSVQTVDNAFNASAFAPTDSFIIPRLFEKSKVVFDSLKMSGNAIFTNNHWGDFDNDGDLDMLAMYITSLKDSLFIVKNNGDTFKILNTGLLQHAYDADWGDYDNDGDLDIVIKSNDINGIERTAVYKNIGAEKFVKINTSFPVSRFGSVKWGDSDNDGDLDILISGKQGETGETRLFVNSGNDQFTDAGVIFNNLKGKLCWVDYNNDGYLDFMSLGPNTDSQNEVIKAAYLYKNLGNNNFEKIPSEFPKFYGSFCDWGDYDNDGDFDLLIGGRDSTFNTYVFIYQNNGNDSFTRINTTIRGYFIGNAEWADLNNDGLLDFYISGSSQYMFSQVYFNEGNNSFKEYDIYQYSDYQTALNGTLGDFDNDNDLDIWIFGTRDDFNKKNLIYENLCYKPNTLPEVPAKLDYSRIGGNIYLSWQRCEGKKRADEKFTYNVRIGTKRYGQDILAPMSDISSGYRRIAETGNAQMNNFKILKLLPKGKYYWTVQSIDHSFVGSAWAPVDSFVITDIIQEFTFDNVCSGNVTHFTNLTTTTDSITAQKWDFGDGTPSSEVNPNHLYLKADTFKVTLWAYSASGDSASCSHDVIVKPSPRASFNVAPVCLGNTSNFINKSDTSLIDVQTWLWDFGNSETSSLQGNVTQTYIKTDTASLKIIATNGCSDADTQVVYIGKYPEFTLNNAQTDDFVLCSDDSSKIYVDPYVPDYIYTWKLYGVELIENESRSYIYAKEEGKYSVTASDPFAGCPKNSNVLTFTSPEKLYIYANEGPDIYYMTCSNTTAKVYNWYHDSILIPSAHKYYLLAGRKTGKYMVEIHEGDKDCIIRSEEIKIGNNAKSSKEELSVIITPNPNDGNFKIQFSLPDMYVRKIDIIQLTGEVIYSENIDKIITEHWITVPHAISGMYLIKIALNNCEISKQLFFQK